MNYLFLFLILFNYLFILFGFECFVCNSDSNNDDTKPCIGKVEKCSEGLPEDQQSCSTLLYFSKRENSGIPHIRKFCTSPGIQLENQLNKINGLCQSVEQWLLLQIEKQQSSFKNSNFIKNQKLLKNLKMKRIFNEQQKSQFLERRKRSNNNDNGSPSPPQSHSSTILCICNKSLCNKGDFEQIMENSQINDIEIKNKNNKFNNEEN
ncbi:hypothetical protein Mgra_00000495 [Meloidogyne graminicola]|uniref:Insulin-like domain-containing protein n=1 Tax=Meloidogyne graminicola TaxID=189291 RepID=A0A8T0A3D4_9BILA|nr:hypothetical protein Mgra_00000495 [Meloidogyne graminicola]